MLLKNQFKDKIYHALYNDDRINILKGRYKGQSGTILRWLFADWYLVKMDKNNVEIVVGVHLGELEPLKEKQKEFCKRISYYGMSGKQNFKGRRMPRNGFSFFNMIEHHLTFKIVQAGREGCIKRS